MSHGAGADAALSVLNAPANMNYSASDLGAGRVQNFSGAGMELPSTMGPAPVSSGWVPGKTGQMDSMGNGTETYFVSQRLRDYRTGQMSMDDWLYRVPNKRSHSIHPSRQVHDEELYGLCHMVHMFKWNAMWRRKFGPLDFTELFTDHFKRRGVQKTDPRVMGLQEKGRVSTTVTVATAGRVTVPNRWLANANIGAVLEGDHLYFIWRKFAWTGAEDASNVEAWRSSGQSQVDRRRARELLEISSEHQERLVGKSGPPPSSTDDDVDNLAKCFLYDMSRGDVRVSLPAAKASEREYFWTCDPWANHAGAGPDPYLYGEDGGYESLGIVSHVMRGMNDATPHQTQLARDYHYPTQAGLAAFKAAVGLDRVEILLGRHNRYGA